MPTVSVIIPSYNHEKFIEQCIQSVLDQTFQDFEIIITDDFSQDSTVEKIRKFDDPRIRLIINDKNRGVSATLNTCIKHSSSEFIACLGSDDAWLPEKLEKQVSYLKENANVGAVFTREIAIDENNHQVNQNIYSDIFAKALNNHTQADWVRYFFFSGNCLCAPSSMMRRKLFDEVGFYDERLAGLQDFDMWVKVCLRHNIHVLEDRLTLYRTHSDSSNLSAQTPENISRHYFEQKQILNIFLQISNIDLMKHAFPESRNYGEITPDLIPYLLGRLALETDNFFQRNWGLETIFHFLGDSDSAHFLDTKLGFSSIDFYNLFKNSKAEPFAILVENERLFLEINSQNAALSSQLQEINLSKAWKLALVLKQIADFMLPTGSIRLRLGRKIFAFLYSPFLIFKKNQIDKDIKLIRDSGLFDEAWYLEKNPDIVESGEDPLRHYMLYGGFEGRDPSPRFSSKLYLSQNIDVKNSNTNPLIHYLQHGKAEGRLIHVSQEDSRESFLNDQKSLQK